MYTKTTMEWIYLNFQKNTYVLWEYSLGSKLNLLGLIRDYSSPLWRLLLTYLSLLEVAPSTCHQAIHNQNRIIWYQSFSSWYRFYLSFSFVYLFVFVLCCIVVFVWVFIFFFLKKTTQTKIPRVNGPNSI